MRLILFIFFIDWFIECNCLPRVDRRFAVHFKDEISADRGIAYVLHSDPNHHFITAKRSNVDPTITIWTISGFLDDGYVEELIEYMRKDINFNLIEEEVVFHTQ